MRRRLEFEATREKQREAAREKQEQLYEDSYILARRIQNCINDIPKRTYDNNMENRTEISCAERQPDWRPYFSKPDIGVSNTLKGVSWTVEKLAINASTSVVSLQSSTGPTKLFSSSGTVVEFSEGTGFIVTVANLVKCPEKDEVAERLKIDVYLQNHECLQGRLVNFDFYHNICVIQIKRTVHLPIKTFSSRIKAINFNKGYPKDVVAVGRDRETHVLLVSTGKIIPKASMLGCEELLVSTCKISKGEVGGLLMDLNGDIIGMNYYHTKETPFIPCFIVSKCLQQFKVFGEVVRPWHGLQVRTLYTEQFSAFEKLQTNLCDAGGVIVEKIEKQSSVTASDLNEGDIINRDHGVYFSTAAELSGILLDIGTKHLKDCPNDQPGMAIRLKFGVRGSEREGTVVVRNKYPSSRLNRWPFPKPIIVQQYCEGELIEEKWYTTEY